MGLVPDRISGNFATWGQYRVPLLEKTLPTHEGEVIRGITCLGPVLTPEMPLEIEGRATKSRDRRSGALLLQPAPITAVFNSAIATTPHGDFGIARFQTTPQQPGHTDIAEGFIVFKELITPIGVTIAEPYLVPMPEIVGVQNPVTGVFAEDPRGVWYNNGYETGLTVAGVEGNPYMAKIRAEYNHATKKLVFNPESFELLSTKTLGKNVTPYITPSGELMYVARPDNSYLSPQLLFFKQGEQGWEETGSTAFPEVPWMKGGRPGLVDGTMIPLANGTFRMINHGYLFDPTQEKKYVYGIGLMDVAFLPDGTFTVIKASKKPILTPAMTRALSGDFRAGAHIDKDIVYCVGVKLLPNGDVVANMTQADQTVYAYQLSKDLIMQEL